MSYTHLTEPEVTRKGMGVGHGLKGELLTELRVLLKTECGHCGGPTCGPPPIPLPPLLDVRLFRHGIFGHPLTSLPDTPETIHILLIILGTLATKTDALMMKHQQRIV